MQDLFEKIQSGQGVCYLNLEQADLKLWNFLASPEPLTNTKLLFYAAARPHFDYFFRHIDYLGLAGEQLMSLAEDEKFFRQLKDFLGMYLPHEMVMSEAAKIIIHKSNVTLITTPNYNPGAAIKADRTIIIDDVNLFGNPEPVWRKVQARLPKTTGVFLLALGTEKFLIGPRLKLKFGLPVIDIGARRKVNAGLDKKLKNLVKRIINK
jgi:hypothetical protein